MTKNQKTHCAAVGFLIRQSAGRKEAGVDFQVGEKVVHWNYGMGEIIKLDEKLLAGQMTHCYVVRIRDLTIWVPIRQMGDSSLRLPTPRDEFENLFAILRSPGELLSNDRLERRMQLIEKIRDGKLDSICQVLRDLTCYRQVKKLNDHDKTILERAQSFLLNEWRLALTVSLPEAELELQRLLGDSVQKAGG
jgi:RNA polymerase-interacting CarD/CdnL/TRCF family regulator